MKECDINMSGLPNHLISEKSPYLYQHAFNPVDWYPWCEEAFNKAKAEDKPVFLSIGYSTCHWCHVMAHESFEDDEVANLLNRNYVSVKVDREERPDIDAVYMEICQALTGSGGWPMTIVMTPDKKPFFAGTYFPKKFRYGMAGLIDILTLISDKWKTSKHVLLDDSEQIVTYMKSQENTQQKIEKQASELIKLAKDKLCRSFDKRWGGFGAIPKFPIPHNLIFLLRYAAFEHDEEALNAAEKTFEQMYRGGIFDHIGGGFSRYSTDEKWLVPHFEKMLYDNAMLIWAYVEAFDITGRQLYKEVVKKIIEYIFSELTDPMGAFYCGQDADSDGVEGKYYTFTPKEISVVLKKDDADKFCQRFGINETGNFEGKSIPNLIDCEDFEREYPDIAEMAQKLYDYRKGRTSLHKDDKILTSWNSLMIIALTKAAMSLDNQEYLSAAIRAQKFISNNLIDRENRLKIRWKSGEAANDGQLEDYAFYGLALLELYRATLDINYLSDANKIADLMLGLFWDEKNSGFYMYSKDAEQLITRPKPIYDGAIPSGNSAAAILLSKLAKLTGDDKWIKASNSQLEYIIATSSTQPAAHTFAMIAIMEEEYPTTDIICVTADSEIPSELSELQRMDSNLNILLKTPKNQGVLKAVAPFTADYPIPEGRALYYLCKDRTCSQPTDNPDVLKKLLTKSWAGRK